MRKFATTLNTAITALFASNSNFKKMIVYNVTIKVDPSIAHEWLNWLKDEHIPDMTSTGCFKDAKVYRLLETDESEGVTYAVQYHAENIDDYKRYLRDFSGMMREKGIQKWNNKFVAFRSLLELVH
jgi:hypothetical protein